MSVEEGQETYRWKARNQYFATFSANLVMISQGCIIGWISPALSLLTSDETPLLSGPLTNEQTSWIGSIASIGALAGALSFGFVIALLGSKRAALSVALPVIIFWLLVYYANSYYHILIARWIGGLSSGGSRGVIILFTSEIANDNIRGRLGSVMMFLRNIGILFGYVLGATVQYEYISLISGAIPIAFLIIFIVIPNTPQFYLRKEKIEKAEKALKFYKGYKGNDQQEDNAIYKEFERLKTIANERKSGEKVQLTDFFTKNALKGLAIGIALATFAQGTADFALITYAVVTFAKVGSHWDPNIPSILLAVALTFGSLASTYLADKLGRRKLNLISLMGCALGLFSTSLYYYLNLCGYDLSAFAWIPVLSCCLVIFLSSAGITPLVYVCSVEYLGSKIRNYGIAIISSWYGLSGFISTRVYPILLESLDLHGCLMIYGFICVVGCIFVLLVLEETSGKSLDDVGKSKD